MGTNLQNSAVFARTNNNRDGTIHAVPHLQLNEFIDVDLLPKANQTILILFLPIDNIINTKPSFIS